MKLGESTPSQRAFCKKITAHRGPEFASSIGDKRATKKSPTTPDWQARTDYGRRPTPRAATNVPGLLYTRKRQSASKDFP